MENLRIVYMGTPNFAVAPLEALLNAGCNIIAVVTVPDKPAGRGLKIRESAVKQFALSKNIPVLQPDKLKDEVWLAEYSALKADLAVVVAFRMLPEVVWSMPRLGTFNLHASLLPYYRGAAPINWPIINGDTYTGVTTFFLNSKIDCGEIIASSQTQITDTDTVGTLHDKLMAIGADLVVKTVSDIANKTVKTHPQPLMIEDSVRAFAPKIFKDDCKINWNASALTIYNKIRGLSPYPTAWCDMLGTTAKLFSSHYICEPHQTSVGTLQNIDNKQIRVAVADGWVYIDTLQLAGAKKPMTADEFLRGNKL